MDISTLYELYLAHPDITTDTRKIREGCLFVALKGEQFDGNDFAEEALRKGAAYAIVSQPQWYGPRFIHVPDTLVALQQLAKHHRRQLRIPVIAITGSNGKTTTKELITLALSTSFKVHATAGNLNNHIGVPLTVLSAPLDTEILVCEMGANHQYEIQFLCELASPTHGLITNIGSAHLEGFGSFEGVKKAKGELFDYLKDHDGLAFINVDDPSLEEMSKYLPHTVRYGLKPGARADFHFEYKDFPDHSGFTIRDRHSPIEITSKMFGAY
ncbi:MAG TPA: Mur ligase family protein, partial [Saprospiraceae bacterium]|nr:Mur ligase family protein [Saprospiraceae bacterium]